MKIERSELANDYHLGMLGNGRTCVLVDAFGKFVFCCFPDFDSGTVFASLLDEEKGGSFGIEMVDGEVTGQVYERNTNILVTSFEGEDGAFELIDFMPRYTADGQAGSVDDVSSDVVRRLKVLRGKPRVRVSYDPQLEYGCGETVVEAMGTGLKATTHWNSPDRVVYESIYLWTDMDDEAVLGGTEVTLDRDRYLVMSYHDKVQVPNSDLVELMLQRTRAGWLLWSARTHLPTQYREEAMRSALVLKMLQFGPTGAILAAATTSLPETIGEERNWDYRFCWLRDASMTVTVLHRIGHPSMARWFIDWMMKTVPTKDDSLQIMYGLRGERKLTERTLAHFSGYQGSKPVRIGNAAYTQEQHDIYGVVVDVIYQDLLLRQRTPEALDRIWTRVRSIVRNVLAAWKEPDRGIWEIRGEKRHFVFSKVLCWVALDRAIKIAELIDKNDWACEHKGMLDEMHEDICKRGWNGEKGAFVQSYGVADLDASNLLLAEYGFLAADDPRFVSTVERSLDELCVDGLMYRYRNQDDFGEPQSAFTVCSFWLVKALVSIRRVREARTLFENLLSHANSHGLYGEDLDFKTRRHLGNFPQAYSHLALIDCALALSKEEDNEMIQA
ncbi:MAG: glycoside hydrolase family 15 protein [Verrucomicrobiales bacterium]|nr:glycoside hydrolase family 15 protein [Verrucomicrobiota bacterium JB025]